MKNAKELPEECWELILNRIAPPEYDCLLKSPSLVSKQFLSITNRIRQKLLVNKDLLCQNRLHDFHKTLQRFPNLKHIEFCVSVSDDPGGFINDYEAISLIASSGCDLRSLSFYHFLRIPPSAESFRVLGSTMKNLKVLNCWGIKYLRDDHLVVIADALPWLEELDICIHYNAYYCPFFRSWLGQPSMHKVTDAGIEVISHKLKGLRKIDISDRLCCSDLSLKALSSRCLRLQEIRFRLCNVSWNGIYWLLCHCPNLVSLQVWESSDGETFATFDPSMICAMALRVLDLHSCKYQDQFLCSIATAFIPLEELRLWNDHGLSLPGLVTFLCACPSLKRLSISRLDFLDDHSIMDVCKYLPNVESVNLSFCSKNSTLATFFVLAKECPRLSDVTLSWFGSRFLEVDVITFMNLERNYVIRSLDLCGYLLTHEKSSSSHSSDEILKRAVVTCPNLQKLTIDRCGLTIEGMEEILNSCSQINHLDVDKHMEILSEKFRTRQINVHYR